MTKKDKCFRTNSFYESEKAVKKIDGGEGVLTLFKNLKYMYHKQDRPSVSGQFGRICLGGS